MDDPDLDLSQTRNTRHFTVLPVPKSILQPRSTAYLVGLHLMFGDLKHLLVFLPPHVHVHANVVAISGRTFLITAPPYLFSSVAVGCFPSHQQLQLCTVQTWR